MEWAIFQTSDTARTWPIRSTRSPSPSLLSPRRAGSQEIRRYSYKWYPQRYSQLLSLQGYQPPPTAHADWLVSCHSTRASNLRDGRSSPPISSVESPRQTPCLRLLQESRTRNGQHGPVSNSGMCFSIISFVQYLPLSPGSTISFCEDGTAVQAFDLGKAGCARV